MLRDRNTKKIISVLLFSLLLSFLMVSGGRLQAVTADECWEAYQQCLAEHGGWLPWPYSAPADMYCGIGLIFCNLYM